MAKGHALVRVCYVSADPAMRGWMTTAPSYIRPVKIGETMRSSGVGEVVICPGGELAVGTLVTVPAGWCATTVVMASVFDRRHAFGALLAAGTPVRVLRRVVGMEVTVPALIAMWGAGAGGVVVGAVVLRLLGAEAVFGGWMAAPALLGSGAALVTTAACTPALRRIGSDTQSWPFGHQ